MGGAGKGVGGPGFGGSESDPPGSGRIFVRGFDFGTTQEQLMAHMGTVGKIIKLHLVGKGEAEVVYQTKAAAAKAMSLDKSTIWGNARFIDVVSKESEDREGFGGGGSDPLGSGRVFVRGFDFGTTQEQFMAHMGSVGQIIKLHWAGKGEAEVVYKTRAAATAAVTSLDKSTIYGNRRFIDVVPKESE